MRSRWLAAALVAAAWVFSVAVFGQLPAQVPTHWGLDGQVDGWSPRALGAFLLPVVATGIVLLRLAVPRIDPRGGNVERFRPEFHLMLNLVVAFLLVLHVATLGAALGWGIDVTAVVSVGLGFLLVGMGNYLPRVRSNFFLGIRTPWTLSSDGVWRATHRLGGRLFVAAGLVVAASALLPAGARGQVVLVAVLAAALVPAVYSYAMWRREQSGRPL
jgi:uncharacterized membrane protein